jgi:hypothetical protein
LVKLIVPESAAAEVAAVWLSAERRVSSLVLYPEARAALARAQRLGRIRQAEVALARHRVEALWSALDRVELTAPLGRRAGDLAERHGLRAYDAIHLASAEHVAEPDTTLVSADVHLLEAAGAMGLTTAPVG